MDSTRSSRAAWIIWCLFALAAVIARFDAEPTAGNVYNIYRLAALRWLGGEGLYPPDLYFNYFPQSAVFFIPWTWLPFDFGGALWRTLNLGIFALGLWQLASVSSRNAKKSGALFLVATIITVALSWSAARYGQMTLAMAGLMMLAAADIQRGITWRAALCIAVAVALKPPAIVLLLVLVAVYPQLILPVAGIGGLLFALPFAMQSPDYVLSQYMAIPEMFSHRAAKVWAYPHLAGLLGSVGIDIAGLEKNILRAVAALAVLVTCWRARTQSPAPGTAFYLYALTACYILLFGEGTEHNTYAMMAPAIGILAGFYWAAKQRGLFAFPVALAIVTISSRSAMKSLPDIAAMGMIKPLVCVVLTVAVVAMAWRPYSSRPSVS